MSNPNKDDLANIKKWLSKQEIEEPIPSKSRDRVFTGMAKQIQHIKPLPSGACHLCSNQTEKLTPVVMKICLACAKRFIKKGGHLKVKGLLLEIFYCENCATKSAKSITTNPLICQTCMKKIGRHYQENMIKSMEGLSIGKAYTTNKPY